MFTSGLVTIKKRFQIRFLKISLKQKIFWEYLTVAISDTTWRLDIQLASSVPGRIAFYGVIWGSFDHLKILLKVLKPSSSFLILIKIDQNFQENDFWLFRSRGCKNVGPQSLQRPGIKKNDVVAFPRLNLLCSGARENTRESHKSQSWWSLGTHNSAPPRPKWMFSTSFERSISYLCGAWRSRA